MSALCIKASEGEAERNREKEKAKGIRYVSGGERDSTSKAQLLIASFFRSWERTRDRENGESEGKLGRERVGER